MNMILIDQENGRKTLVNPNNVTFVRDYKTHRVIYFVGGNQASMRTKLTLTEIQRLLT